MPNNETDDTRDNQKYFKEPKSDKLKVNYQSGPAAISRNGNAQASACLMSVSQLNNRRRMQDSNSLADETAVIVAGRAVKTIASRQDSITSMRTTMLQSSSINLV